MSPNSEEVDDAVEVSEETREDKYKFISQNSVGRCSSAIPKLSSNAENLRPRLRWNSIDLGHIKIQLLPSVGPGSKSNLENNNECTIDKRNSVAVLYPSTMYPSSIIGKGKLFL